MNKLTKATLLVALAMSLARSSWAEDTEASATATIDPPTLEETTNPIGPTADQIARSADWIDRTHLPGPVLGSVGDLLPSPPPANSETPPPADTIVPLPLSDTVPFGSTMSPGEHPAAKTA